MPGLEIHYVVADAAAPERQRGVLRFAEQRKVDAEALVRRLRAGDRLEHQIDRRALGDEIERGGDVREHAHLRRDVELDAHLVEHGKERMRPLRAVGRGIDADDGIAGAEEEAVENARGDAGGIVGRMIGLQPHREPAGKPDGVAEAGHDRALRRHHHQVLQAADLAHRRRHLRDEAARERGEPFRRRRVGEEPVAQAADGEMRDRSEGRRIVGVDDETRYLIALVGDHMLGEERRERELGERVLRRHPLLSGRRRDARQRVAAARRRGLGQQRLEIGEEVAARSDRHAVHVGGVPLRVQSVAVPRAWMVTHVRATECAVP